MKYLIEGYARPTDDYPTDVEEFEGELRDAVMASLPMHDRPGIKAVSVRGVN